MRRFARNKAAVGALAILAVYLAFAFLAPWIATHDPYAMDAEGMFAAPGSDHWFGADRFGRDVFSRVIHGARQTFRTAVLAVGVALLAGTIWGMAAGYLGGAADTILARLMEMLFAFPDLLLALAVIAVLGGSAGNLAIAIGIVYTPVLARTARDATRTTMRRDYVEAAHALGIPPRRILLRHVLPNILHALVVQTTLCLAFAVLAESALAFLGFGVEPDLPSWGRMLHQAKDWMDRAWWGAVFPGLAITLAVLALNLVGDGLRDALDPRREDR